MTGRCSPSSTRIRAREPAILLSLIDEGREAAGFEEADGVDPFFKSRIHRHIGTPDDDLRLVASRFTTFIFGGSRQDTGAKRVQRGDCAADLADKVEVKFREQVKMTGDLEKNGYGQYLVFPAIVTLFDANRSAVNACLGSKGQGDVDGERIIKVYIRPHADITLHIHVFRFCPHG